MRLILYLSNFLILILISNGFTQVSLLEAIHIAEIRTTKAVSDWSVQEYKGDEHYVITVSVNDAGQNYWIHKTHGRVSKVEELAGGRSKLIEHWPGIKVVAHRGGVGLGVPENTIPAIKRAIEVGVQMIEIDIRETKDGHLVLMHDSTVNRTTNGNGHVDEMTLAEIQQLDAGSWLSEEFKGTKVPTLKEALKVMKGKIDPDLDFKEGNLNKLVDVVNEAGIADQCTHFSSWQRCKSLSQIEPRIFNRPTIDYPEQIPQLTYDLNPPIINMDWNAVCEESIRKAHIYGSKAFINCLSTADTLLNARIAAQAGADYIQTDYPDKVIELLKKMGLMYDPALDIGPRRNYLANPNLGYPLR